MRHDDLRSESMSFQWDFYERAINNYSIIMRMLSCFEEEDSLISRIPKAFVEESLFDMCKIFKDDRGIEKEGFFSIEDSLNNIGLEAVRTLNGGAISPSLINDAFGYHTLYVYPLKRDIEIIGFLILGKKFAVDLDQRFLREIEIVCSIYNKSLLLHLNLRKQKSEVYSKGFYESALNEFPDAMLLVDRNGYISFANKRARNEFEGSKGLLIGEKIDNIVTGISDDFYRKDGPVQGEVNFKSREQFKIFQMQSYPVKGVKKDGSWKGIIFKDVLEIKIKEEENLLKDKMENMGMLAGGIAHDFNNLLTGVLGYASLIKNFLSSEEKLYRYAEAIEHSAQRAAKLTQHLLNFSRRQRKATGIVDLNVLLDDILFLLRESFRDVEVEKTFDDLLPPIRGDEADLQNVFLNLCMNAKDAMKGEGLLKVKTKRRKNIGGREFASVEIEDTGQGIDDEIREKIFQPYFTTKETGSNLGMGLYLVDKVIKEHGGFIECESEPGKGTRFTLYIPLPLEIIGKQVEHREPSARASLKKRKVLIVDDENIVRELIKGVLSEEGIQVLKAVDGYEAIEVFRENQSQIDLVILDMIMPGIKGDEVLKAIRGIRNDIKIIISSGFMSEDQRERLREYRVDGFLDKPYKDKDVLRAITKILSD
jgi:nitrogen-specific signal transduction histidine kinase/ActR/RegA family two-component response regulator